MGYFASRCELFCKRLYNTVLVNSRRLCTGIESINSFYRTHTCGELQTKHDGQEVTLCGWILAHRFTKFIVLKDGYGKIQVLLDHCDPSIKTYVTSLPLESVIQVKGVVQKRPKGKINKEMGTGEMEVNLKEAKLLAASSANIPYTAKDLDKVGDVPKLQYRSLYLRNPMMQTNLRIRSEMVLKIRNYLSNIHGFVEVQTPALSRHSPGGAKEFVVLSDFPGKVYSLTQSPQMFKQLLMIGQLDKYYQIACCFRNESTKSDRQQEFYQVDIEASFTTAKDIQRLVECLLKYSWPEGKPMISIPFSRMTFKDAMHQYGSDKPDLRYDMKLQYLTEEVMGHGIEIFEKSVTGDDCVVAAIVVPNGSKHISKSQQKDLKERAKLFSQDLLDIQVKKDLTWNSPLAKHVTADFRHRVNSILNVNPLDLILLSAGKYKDVVQLLGKIRVNCAEYLESAGVEISKPGDFKFLWVEDFPLFQQNEDGYLESTHHPFTAPHPNDIDLIYTNPTQALSQHYDLVLNGQEIGGGSVRIMDASLQQYILEDILKLDTNPFKHLLDHMQYGCPPHAGIALGVERLLAIICGCRTIADVIAFPKSRDGRDLLTGAPMPLSEHEANQFWNDMNLKQK